MKYLVYEIQTYADGTIGIPPVPSFDKYSDAQARYYSILAAAAISNLPIHTAEIVDNKGKVYIKQCFDRTKENSEIIEEQPFEEESLEIK